MCFTADGSTATLFVCICCGFVGFSHIHVALKLQPFLIMPTAAATLQRFRALEGRGFGNLYWPSFNPNSPAEEGSLCCRTGFWLSSHLCFTFKKTKNLPKTGRTKDFKSLQIIILTYCLSPGCLFFMEMPEFNLGDVFFCPLQIIPPPPLKLIIFSLLWTKL